MDVLLPSVSGTFPAQHVGESHVTAHLSQEEISEYQNIHPPFPFNKRIRILPRRPLNISFKINPPTTPT